MTSKLDLIVVGGGDDVNFASDDGVETLADPRPQRERSDLGQPVDPVHPGGPLPGQVVEPDVVEGDLAGASNVPAWMRHYRGVSGMTFVDVVFPAFLFIVVLVGAALFFCSDASSFVTGTALVVDGGGLAGST